MDEFQLAQINIGRLIAPLDDPQIAEFVAGLDPINALAEQSTGFIWRFETACGNATDIVANDRPLLLLTLGVSGGPPALAKYVKQPRPPPVFEQARPPRPTI